MRRGTFFSNIVKWALDDHSNKYPNKLVNPQSISCFVLDEVNGRMIYYPVVGLAKTERDIQVYNGETGLHTYQDITIDKYSFCQNPVGIKTPISAADLLRFEEKLGQIDYYRWFCPQLDTRLYYPWDKETHKPVLDIVSEGIVIFIALHR